MSIAHVQWGYAACSFPLALHRFAHELIGNPHPPVPSPAGDNRRFSRYRRVSEPFRNWCDAAGLPKRCKPHALRKAACRRLAEAGCSVNEIMSISGHTTMKEIVRYTVAAEGRADHARWTVRTTRLTICKRRLMMPVHSRQGARSGRCRHGGENPLQLGDPAEVGAAESLDALLPVLYLRGPAISRRCSPALLGKEAPNLSPAVITRLTTEWQADRL